MIGRTQRLLAMQRRADAVRKADRRERDADGLDYSPWWELNRAELDTLIDALEAEWRGALAIGNRMRT